MFILSLPVNIHRAAIGAARPLPRTGQAEPSRKNDLARTGKGLACNSMTWQSWLIADAAGDRPASRIDDCVAAAGCRSSYSPLEGPRVAAQVERITAQDVNQDKLPQPGHGTIN
jgi:hypothetical protein